MIILLSFVMLFSKQNMKIENKRWLRKNDFFRSASAQLLVCLPPSYVGMTNHYDINNKPATKKLELTLNQCFTTNTNISTNFLLSKKLKEWMKRSRQLLILHGLFRLIEQYLLSWWKLKLKVRLGERRGRKRVGSKRDEYWLRAKCTEELSNENPY